MIRIALRRTALVLALACAPVVQAAEVVYVQSRQAKLLAAPGFDAAVVATIDKGAALDVLGQQGRWLKVGHQQQQGWVAELLVGKQPPNDKVTVVNDGASDLKQNARLRASATTSTAAARGLRNDDRARESDDAIADYSALDEMERLKVSDEETRRFLEEGMK